jgi:hypothetical protein
LVAVITALCFAQTGVRPRTTPLVLDHPVQDKNFLLLSLLQRDSEVRRAIDADAALHQLAGAKRDAMKRAAETCADDAGCLNAAFRLSDEEISAAGDALRKLAASVTAVRNLADGALKESGAYVLYAAEPGPEALAHAWRDAAKGINRLIGVYGEGVKGRYAEIDAAAFDVKSPTYRQMMRTVAGVLQEKAATMPLFFDPSLQYSLYLMQLSHRDEAGRHEPMEQKDNREAYLHIRSIRWADYPYTAIVVPGAGSDRTTWNLSPSGHLRCEIAARRYHEKKAPLILVSGGYVHPNQTPYAEAIEMKRVLMAEFSVPEEAILVDPHARHTTTNLRNAARILYRYGVPLERKGLISTDYSQSSYIESPVFTKRCADELGFQPHRLLTRTSPFDLEFFPLIESLQIDPTDPLDP